MNKGYGLWDGFTLRDALAAGFCATFIVLSGLFLHVPLHLPGHRVLPLAFFLLLGRTRIRGTWAATVIGLAAGAVTLALGRGELTHCIKYVVAGVTADAIFLLAPSVARSAVLAALAGALIGASWVPLNFLADRLYGMDRDMALIHTLIKSSSAILFGTAGGALAPGVARRLAMDQWTAGAAGEAADEKAAGA